MITGNFAYIQIATIRIYFYHRIISSDIIVAQKIENHLYWDTLDC